MRFAILFGNRPEGNALRDVPFRPVMVVKPHLGIRLTQSSAS
jgi:hypothetical protein